jgi:transposase
MDMDVDLGLEMKISRRELRVLLLHGFRFNRKATEATSNICGTMGKDVISIRTAQHWFNRFKNSNFELDDLPRSGRPLEVDTDVLKQLIEEDPRLTTRCLAERPGCSHTAVEKHLSELGKT